MPLNKSFRVKLYRRQSGPFECVVIATSRTKAQAKAARQSREYAKRVLAKFTHELAPLPVSNTKETEFNMDGTLKHKPSGKAVYPKGWTAGAKVAKPRPVTRGDDRVVSVSIRLVGVVK